MNWDLISELLLKLSIAILPPLAAAATAYLIKAYQAKRAELTEKQQWMLDNVVQLAVKAAEQLYKSGEGAQKKEYAIGVAEAWLAQHKIKMDLHVLDAAIEAAVFDHFTPLPEA